MAEIRNHTMNFGYHVNCLRQVSVRRGKPPRGMLWAAIAAC